MYEWLRNKIRGRSKLKTYRVSVINPERTKFIWHTVMAINEEEALLMRTYINDEGWEA